MNRYAQVNWLCCGFSIGVCVVLLSMNKAAGASVNLVAAGINYVLARLASS